jgi:UDP-N-acetylmuramyl tripeptide synthase
VLIAGIIGSKGKEKTSNLINSILSGARKRMSIIDSKNLLNLDSKRLKDYMGELRKNNTEILILKIDIYEIVREIFNGLRFDIIIFSDKADDTNEINMDNYRECTQRVFSLLNEKGIAIVNADDNELIKFLEGIRHCIVTYGFNLKASITASSIGDLVVKDNFMCCLQRTIFTSGGRTIEPQEFKVKADLEGVDPYNILAAATFALVNGIDLNSMTL